MNRGPDSESACPADLPSRATSGCSCRVTGRKVSRGNHSARGRRYYRPDDVELLKGIRYLLYVRGFTIRGVQRILKESGHRAVMAVGTPTPRLLGSLAGQWWRKPLSGKAALVGATARGPQRLRHAARTSEAT